VTSRPAAAGENAALQTGRLAAATLDTLDRGVMVFVADGPVLYCNPRGRCILGYSDLSAATPIRDVFQERIDPERFVAHGRRTGERCPVLHSSHGRSVVVFQLQPIAGDGFPEGPAHLLVFGDGEQVNRRRRQSDLDLCLTSVSRLLPSLAHEIKNPLASIRGLVEVILADGCTDGQRADLEVVMEEVDRLRILVDRLSSFDEDMFAGHEMCNLPDIIYKVFRVSSRRAMRRGISIAYEGPEHVGMMCNPELFFMVLNNLLGNAIDACSRGDRITVTIVHAPAVLSVTVLDTGCGMTPAVVDRATEPFFTTKSGGTGLGLPLVKEIVSRCGGHLTVVSREAHGTEVTITVPLER